MAVILQLFCGCPQKERPQQRAQPVDGFKGSDAGRGVRRARHREDPLGFLEVPVSSEGILYTASLAYFDDQWRSVEERIPPMFCV